MSTTIPSGPTTKTKFWFKNSRRNFRCVAKMLWRVHKVLHSFDSRNTTRGESYIHENPGYHLSGSITIEIDGAASRVPLHSGVWYPECYLREEDPITSSKNYSYHQWVFTVLASASYMHSYGVYRYCYITACLSGAGRLIFPQHSLRAQERPGEKDSK